MNYKKYLLIFLSIFILIACKKLPENNIECVVVPRKKYFDKVISASTVRQIIKNGNLEDLKNLVPDTPYNYFLSDEAKPVIDKIRSQADVIHY